MAVVGADGCRGGWFAIRLEQNGTWQPRVFGNASELWEAWGDASLILLDVPIGLPDGQEERRCDKEARQMLGQPRGSSVFPVPCRAAVMAAAREAASQLNRQVTGRELGAQGWGIVPKIREVDLLLSQNRDARSRIREIHPEVCFWAFAGGHPMASSKATRPGYEERKEVLDALDARTHAIVQGALQRFRRARVARHDVLDALAAALTAESPVGLLTSIPPQAEWDARHLRMEMVYRSR